MGRDHPGRPISRNQKRKRESLGTLKDKSGIVKKMKKMKIREEGNFFNRSGCSRTSPGLPVIWMTFPRSGVQSIPAIVTPFTITVGKDG
jgi:hypothetical protein